MCGLGRLVGRKMNGFDNTFGDAEFEGPAFTIGFDAVTACSELDQVDDHWGALNGLIFHSTFIYINVEVGGRRLGSGAWEERGG